MNPLSRFRQKLFANFAHPRGLLGRLAGRIMARKESNTARARWAIDQLGAKPDARVLEVGYGPGVGLAMMAAGVPEGTVVGVDSSEVMRSQASRRNAAAIRDGRVELHVGDAQHLDAVLGRRADFDLVYGINVWQFWSDQTATVAALASRLAPGGRLALVYMQPPTGSTAADEAEQRLHAQFAAAGLDDLSARIMTFDPPAVMMVGHRN